MSLCHSYTKKELRVNPVHLHNARSDSSGATASPDFRKLYEYAIFSGTSQIYLLIAVIVLLCTGEISSQRNYFYTNKPYGSEALFNPVSFIFNGGYDVAQLQLVSNRIQDHNYREMWKTVIGNLGHPIKSIEVYGWNRFLRTEFLPISFTKNNMQWIPNYQQHLIGGGMMYTAMAEWYREQGVPWPKTFSFVTVMSQHLLNEVIETGPAEGYSVDEVSDIYIFDLGGILLFSFDSVNEFFADELNLSDWSLQASVTLPNGRVNAGQYFSVKWEFPFWQNHALFYRYGMGALFGISEKLNEEEWLSYGIGFKTKHLVDLETEFKQRTIETGWHAGIFWDRNNSLLASLVFSGVKEYFVMADVYPGILKTGNFSPGVWAIAGRDGTFLFGLTTKYLIGAGAEFR